MSKLLQQLRLDTITQKTKERANPKSSSTSLRKVVTPRTYIGPTRPTEPRTGR